MAPSTFSFHPSTLMAAGSTSPRSGFPDRAILCEAPRISELRNATTAECETSEGETVEVSFWLVDPPGVSYFSINCPGLDVSLFADDMNPPWLICAEGAFVLFTVTVRGTTDHLVYTAGPAGKQSLQLLPDPNAGPHRKHPYALLPRGGDRYAVAFLERDVSFLKRDVSFRFETSVFSSETQAWRRSRVSLQHLSESEKSLCALHGLSKQIAIGVDSLGWVDLASGILLLQNLFDDAHPVIRFIHFPESRVRFLDEDGLPHRSEDHYCNVSCCGDLIKFVNVEFDDPAILTSGQGWRATMWDRKISWNKWRCRSTVDVANISLDQSYSALLPLPRDDDEIQPLELKRLIFYTPVPSIHNDDIMYMMAKVNDEDDTAWAIAVDMERAVVEAMAPFSAQVYSLVSLHRPCVFPKYLYMTPGAGMGNPVDKCFKRLSAKQCLVQVLWTLDWLRELDQCLEIERSTYNTCRLLLQLSPVSSLRSNIESVVKYASYNGQGEAASKAVDFCLRALDDFDKLLRESPLSDPSTTEAMKSQIGVALGALDSVLEFVPLTHMPRRVQMMLADVCLQRDEQALVFGHCEEPCHAQGRSDEQQQAGRSNPSNSGQTQKKKETKTKKKNKKKKQQQQKAQVLGRRSPAQSYLLYFVGCVLVAVAVKAVCRHLGSV